MSQGKDMAFVLEAKRLGQSKIGASWCMKQNV
jgi:hypothetical protein